MRSLSRRTSSTVPRASGCSTSGAGRTSGPSSKAGRRNAAAGRGRRTWRPSSAWPRRSNGPSPPERLARLARLRRRLYRGLREALGDLFVCNTPMDEGAAAPHLLNIAFPPHDGRPFDGEMLILNLDMEGIAVSSGSACTSGALTPSHVLQALGHDAATAAAAIRFSLGKDTTEEEIDRTVDAVARVVRRMLAVM
ncbi:aminotransferase class V-fold PLP-dependent enzyme [Rhodocaloribacter litoris]|uniref:aminotransferase class V-fold PLP-dependent enzyme n=1 Tax=Rhodocaloribacter litoris TaxID=2558931 RepID=UPI0021D47329|nr:aminotransferase class V-fold PLP-dependent enzyme [Rhodocaloribacter litoris]